MWETMTYNDDDKKLNEEGEGDLLEGSVGDALSAEDEDESPEEGSTKEEEGYE